MKKIDEIKSVKFSKKDGNLLYTIIDTWVKNQKDSIKAVREINQILNVISLNIEQDNGDIKDGSK